MESYQTCPIKLRERKERNSRGTKRERDRGGVLGDTLKQQKTLNNEVNEVKYVTSKTDTLNTNNEVVIVFFFIMVYKKVESIHCVKIKLFF